MPLPSLEEIDAEKLDITIDEVRISPATIIFEDPFECRHYVEKITIQNCGKKMAFVRILQPSSYYFQVKPILRGVYLSSGLKIVKKIRYIYHQSNVSTFATLPIIVNSRQADIVLKVKLLEKFLTVSPSLIDLGKVNVAQLSQPKFFTITNEDTKPINFAVDNFVSAEVQFFIQPNKGRVDAKRSRMLHIQARGLKAGKYSSVMWIRSHCPIDITVYCEAVDPKFEIDLPMRTKDFTLLDFSYVYIGATVEKFICVDNLNTNDSMACILGEWDKKPYPYEEAIKLDVHMKRFSWDRYTAYFSPNVGEIFRILYVPGMSENFPFRDQAYESNFSIFRILRLDYEGVEPHDSKEYVSISVEDRIKRMSSRSMNFSSSSDTAIWKDNVELVPVCFPASDSIQLYIHGIATKVDIDMTPDSLVLSTIEIKKKELRVLRINNNSKRLPITIQYEKIPFIDVLPSSKDLKPLETIELEVQICPHRLGLVKQKIKFNLLWRNDGDSAVCNVGTRIVPISFNCVLTYKEPPPLFNLGLTPALADEVGINTSNVRFNSVVPFPRIAVVNQNRMADMGSDLVAFPNDRPKSLRPWGGLIPIRTIFTRMPRVVEINDRWNAERLNRRQQDEYYTSYIRKTAATRRGNIALPPIEDYDLTDRSLLLGRRCRTARPAERERYRRQYHLVPLTPLELFYVKISPRQIVYGKIAQFSRVEEYIQVRNDNNFPIDILLKSSHENVSFPGVGRYTLGPRSEITLEFRFTTFREEGFHIVPVDVIINDTSSLLVTLIGDIIPRSLEVSSELIEFKNDSTIYQYLIIHNPFTCVMSYYFDYVKSSFDVEPLEGFVEPGKSMINYIKYNPQKLGIAEMELCLLTEGRLDKTITIRANRDNPSVSFRKTKLVFGDIPVNIYRFELAFIENTGCRPVQFTVVNPDPMPGIRVTHASSILHSNSHAIIRVDVQMETMGKFFCVINVNIQEKKIINFTVEGNVLLPQITVKPNLLTFRRIVNHSFDTLYFWVANVGKMEAEISFNMNDYKELLISESSKQEKEIETIELEPGQHRRLCMHFNPIDVTSQRFYLPIFVNGINMTELGLKALAEKPLTKNKKKISNSNSDDAGSVLLTKVSAEVLTEGISFSKTNFNLKYYPHPNYPTVNCETLRIFNAGLRTEAFCLRTDKLSEPVSLEPAANSELVEINDKSLSAVLEPGEGVDFVLLFQPTSPCSLTYKLPVYVKGKMNGAVYKFIKITGYFPNPTLEVNHPIIYLEPVPLRTTTETTTILTAKYHMQICKYTAYSSDSDIKVYSEDSRLIDPRNIENVFTIRVSFVTRKSKVVEAPVTFSCGCGAECTIRVKGCSENCTLTNHCFLRVYCGENIKARPFVGENNFLGRSSMLCRDICFDSETLSIVDLSTIMEDAVNYNLNCFPYFPDQTDNSIYGEHMNQTLNTVERWVNAEGFYGEKYLTIPDGFLIYPSFMGKSDKDILPIITLLKNLAGPAIAQRIQIKKSWNKSNLEMVQYLWLMYDTIKTLLTGAGAFLPNIEPEYLLAYGQYKIFVEQILPLNNPEGKSLTPLTLQKFSLVRKQNWLDLLLQIYKVFQLYPGIDISKSKIELPSTSHDKKIELQFNELYIGGIYHTIESILLYWLENIHNNNLDLFPEGELEKKLVKLFDVDLSGGSILAVVTAAYCPYLKSEFDNFYWQPSSYNEATYNACKLIMVWDMIHCRSRITPEDIINPDPLEMLMFVFNLYDFLPGMIPLEKIEMFAHLSDKHTKSIIISNHNAFPVKFTTHFFHDEYGCFSTEPDKIVLNSKQTKTVDVTYHAKRLKSMEVYLLFSGENEGYHLAKNRVYHIVTTTDMTKPYAIYTCSTKLYDFQNFTKVIEAPFKVAATYDIKILIDETSVCPGSPEKLMPVEECLRSKIPRRVIYPSNLVCDENGVGNFTFEISAIIQGTLAWTVLFTNPDVGEFSILINLIVKVKKNWEKLTVGISSAFLNSECICTQSRNPRCPKFVRMMVPCRSPIIFKCLHRCLLRQFTSEEDIAFWSYHSGTYAGIAIMKRHLEDCKAKHLVDFNHFLHIYCIQTVTIVSDANVDAPKEVLINIIEDQHFPMWLHIDTQEIPETLEMTLCRTLVKVERYFKINFTLCDE